MQLAHHWRRSWRRVAVKHDWKWGFIVWSWSLQKVDRWQLITLAKWKSLELTFQTQLRTQLYPEPLDVNPHTSNGFRSSCVRNCVLKLCSMHLSSEFYVAFFHSLILLCTARPWKLCVSKLLGFEKKSNCSRTKQKMETKFFLKKRKRKRKRLKKGRSCNYLHLHLLLFLFIAL